MNVFSLFSYVGDDVTEPFNRLYERSLWDDGTCRRFSALGRQLEPVQCALARKQLAVVVPGRHAAEHRTGYRILAELAVIVEILVTDNQAQNALADHHG